MQRFLTAFVFSTLLLTALPAEAQETAKTVPENRTQISLSFAPLVKQIAPAVVNIYSKRVVTRRVSPFMNDPFFDQFFGDNMGAGGLNRRQVERSLGSGLIVEADGLIVTNAHVVHGADEITVVLPDGREFEAKKLLEDAPSDLAVLRVEPGEEKLPFATLEPSEKLEVGDMVLAIGNPFGVGQTVTSGIVSALARSSLNINDFNFFIQTDAAINPGNSGGPLVAMDGGIVGINSAIFSRDGGSLGIGFAIPSEMVATVIAAGKAGGDGSHGVVRAWLGVQAQGITQDIADSMGLKKPGGVLVSALHGASPAKKAGLEVGDVIVAINGRPVHDPSEMKFRLATVPIGEQADLDISHKGVLQTLRIKAIAPPEDPPRQETLLTGYHPLNGVHVSNINPAVEVEQGINDEEGVVVTEVDNGAVALRIVHAGDVIVGVNGVKIGRVDDLQKALNKTAPEGWQLIISRDGQKRQVIVR